MKSRVKGLGLPTESRGVRKDKIPSLETCGGNGGRVNNIKLGFQIATLKRKCMQLVNIKIIMDLTAILHSP